MPLIYRNKSKLERATCAPHQLINVRQFSDGVKSGKGGRGGSWLNLIFHAVIANVF